MTKFFSLFLSCILLIAPMSSYALFGNDDPDEERKELRQARTAALARLYEESPHAKDEIQNSVGYAVFSSLGMNLFFLATEHGGGILHENDNDKDTFMRMFSAGGGLGMGIKDINLVFIFHTKKAMDDFQSEGWDFSGKADASAETNGTGTGLEAAITVIPGTTIYQLTKSGLALQATLQGTKFWPDEDLN